MSELHHRFEVYRGGPNAWYARNTTTNDIGITFRTKRAAQAACDSRNAVRAEKLAARLRCNDCADEPALAYEGQFGSVTRYQCPECLTSFPEGSPIIRRQFSVVGS